MALDAAEEENIEALKRWWEDNGKQLSAAVIFVAMAWGGWTLWENSRDATMSSASDLYEEILSLSVVGPDVEITDADRVAGGQLAHADVQLQVDTSAVENDRQEFYAYTELLELDRH